MKPPADPNEQFPRPTNANASDKASSDTTMAGNAAPTGDSLTNDKADEISVAAEGRNKKGAVPQTIWDLVFTLLIPIGILSPNLFGSGFSVAAVLGGGTAGNIRAYLAAALVPVVYVAWDLIKNKNVSPVALLGGAGALVGGALAFWYVDGFWYAIKDSARSYLLGLAFLVSAGTRLPLFRIFLDAASLSESGEDRSLTQRALRDPAIHKAIAQATIVFGIIDLISGVINSVVNYQRVIAKFGTDDFNAQVAHVNAIMRVPGMAISLVGVGLAFWLLHRATQQRFGEDTTLFEPKTLRGKL